jgi:AraC-like DNA-binding protein
MMAEYAAEAGRQQGSASDQRLERMRAAISSEYVLPLQLGDLARRAGLSPQHLLRLCRERGEPTPLEQLYRVRLENSADLLLHTGLSVKEISERCGFANAFHFSRKFRLWSGLPPRDYRARGNGVKRPSS